VKRGEELLTKVLRHPEEKRAAFRVRFLQDRVLVVEVVECLGQLEGVFGNMGGLAGRYRPVNSAVDLGSREKKLPEILRSKLVVERLLGEHGCEIG